MTMRREHRVRLVERIAHWSGVLWLLLVLSQLAIAIHDQVAMAEDAVNYVNVHGSVRVSLWFLCALAALNLWGWGLRSWWRADPPPFLDWLLRYNVRVAIAFSVTEIVQSLIIRIWWLPGHAWFSAHMSWAYFLGTLGALAGVPLLTTQRWREFRAISD